MNSHLMHNISFKIHLYWATYQHQNEHVRPLYSLIFLHKYEPINFNRIIWCDIKLLWEGYSKEQHKNSCDLNHFERGTCTRSLFYHVLLNLRMVYLKNPEFYIFTKRKLNKIIRNIGLYCAGIRKSWFYNFLDICKN